MIFKFKQYLLIFTLISCHFIYAEPILKLTTPKDENMTVYESSVTFKGTIENANKLTINGLEIPISMTGQFEHAIELNSKNGNNYFLIEASDGTTSIQLNRTIFYNENTAKEGKKATTNEVSQNKPSTMEKIIKTKKENDIIYKLSRQDAIDALRKYIGEKTRGSYAFSEITIQDYVKIFAKEHAINIINNVKLDTTLTVELNDMHPADVFDTLISYWGCNWIMKDKIIRVIEQRPVRVYQLSYLKGEEFIQLVSGISQATTFKTNPIDNSIIAQGPIEDLNYIDSLINQLDVKPKQVLIEATIIETNFDISSLIGTDPSSIIKTTGNETSPYSLSTLGYTFSVAAFEDNSNINVLANPQILVTNHKTASINTGNQIGYSTTTVTETSTVENVMFLNTGITLQITPHISENGEILMELNPSISDGQVTDNKPISTNTSTSTQVIIKDGETIVIGGLIQKKKSKTNSKVPFLSDVPVLNLLFQQSQVTEQKMELSVLITPHIIHDTEEINQQ